MTSELLKYLNEQLGVYLNVRQQQKMNFQLFKFLKLSYVLLYLCMNFCYHQALKGSPSPVAFVFN